MGFKNDGLKNFTVYMHRNKINNKKYIGITSQEPKKRWMGGNGYNNNIHFHKAINKYGWDNFEHLILYTGLSKEDAIKIEIELIQKYNSTNRDCGYNIGLGGEGYNSLSEEGKARILAAHLGVKRSKETCKRISESRIGEKNWRYGVKLTEEHKRALINSRLGKPISEEQKDRITETRGYTTFQYDMNGNFIASYRSTGEAGRIMQISHSGIKACCEKRIPSNHGFIFRFESDGYIYGQSLPQKDIDEANKTKNKHLIYQCDMEGNVIRKFDNLTLAGKELHIDRHDISKCIKGEKESAGGYIWKKAS